MKIKELNVLPTAAVRYAFTRNNGLAEYGVQTEIRGCLQQLSTEVLAKIVQEIDSELRTYEWHMFPDFITEKDKEREYENWRVFQDDLRKEIASRTQDWNGVF